MKTKTKKCKFKYKQKFETKEKASRAMGPWPRRRGLAVYPCVDHWHYGRPAPKDIRG